MRPLGAPGTRKLQDILVDLKVPAHLRPRVPLVLAGDRIMWVGGMVMAEEGRIDRDTTRMVRLSLRRVGESPS
jgi:tRNA(Ile)-lysidine synthase